MANDYFNQGTKLPRTETARAEAINEKFSGVEAAFDKFPSSQAVANRTLNYSATEGLVNAYTVTLEPTPAAYSVAMTVDIKPSEANTGASTINVNGLGPAPILTWDGSALTGGEIPNDRVTQLQYDGTAFRLSGISTVLTDNVAALVPYTAQIGAIGANISAVVACGGNIPAITSVNTNMTDVQTVAANIPTIVQAAEIYAENNDVSSQILFMELAL